MGKEVIHKQVEGYIVSEWVGLQRAKDRNKCKARTQPSRTVPPPSLTLPLRFNCQAQALKGFVYSRDKQLELTFDPKTRREGGGAPGQGGARARRRSGAGAREREEGDR